MRSSSYQKTFEKIHKRLMSILNRMNFEIINDDTEKGILSAIRNTSIFSSGVELEIKIKIIDDKSTQIFISAKGYKNWFKISEKRLNNLEEGILSLLS